MNTAINRIGDACQVGDGAHASIKRVDSGIPYLMARNLKDGRLDLSRVSYITRERYEKHFKATRRSVTRVQQDDVIFGIIGSIGDAYLVKQVDEFGLSSSVAILRPDTNLIVPKYLYYWVRGPLFQQALMGIKGGVAQGYVSLEMMRSLPLRAPSHSTQRRIASVLSAYDDLIENNTRRIAILEEMARRLYEEWFVHFRFPGHEGVRMVESETGDVPDGWPVCRLGDQIEFRKGKKPKKIVDELCDGLVPQILVDVLRGGVPKYTDPEEMVLVGKTDTIMVMDGSNSSDVFSGIEGAIGSTLGRYRLKQGNDLSPYWLYLFFSYHGGNIRSNNIGSAIPHANKEYIAGMSVAASDPVISDKFGQLVEPMFDLTIMLKRKNSNLRTQRDLLLPKLISGEIDVSEVPEPSEEVEAA